VIYYFRRLTHRNSNLQILSTKELYLGKPFLESSAFMHSFQKDFQKSVSFPCSAYLHKDISLVIIGYIHSPEVETPQIVVLTSLSPHYSLTIQESNSLKHDTLLQIRINKMRKQLIQEQLGETSISDFIRTSLNNLLIQEHTNTHSWKVDEYNKRRI
jgi:hypothetical protein